MSAVILSRAALRAVAPARSARAFATVDWSAVMGKLTTDAAKSEISKMRGVYGEAASLAATYSAPPAPIDFASYKGKVDPEMLAAAEKSYTEFSASTDKPTYACPVRDCVLVVAPVVGSLRARGLGPRAGWGRGRAVARRRAASGDLTAAWSCVGRDDRCRAR
jgi:hypothetical protein